MIIETEIYGIIPKVKIEKFSNEPPENILIRPKTVPSPPPFSPNPSLDLNNETFTPGVETKTPNL